MIHVLAHGIARFDALWHSAVHFLPARWQKRFDCLNYFRNIKTDMTSAGFDTVHSDVPFAESIHDRARVLKENIDKLARENPKQQFHIIGHSMGGLDARYAIAALGLQNVAVLSTIGTPHLGTPFADWGFRVGHAEQVIGALAHFVSLTGLRDLTIDACRTFNEKYQVMEARNGVAYRAYAAAEPLALVFTPLQKSWSIINAAEGENDGLVSVRSQLWTDALRANECAGQTIKTVAQIKLDKPLDHFNECGWWDRREPDRKQFEAHVRAIYREIATAAELCV